MNRTHSLPSLILAVALTAVVARAESVDLDAEAKQAAKEDADQKAERAQGVTGKYQRTFYGTFQSTSQGSELQQANPEVVGTYLTNETDRKPGRTYQVKVENGNKGIIDALKRVEGKKAELIGKLRNIGPDGEAKYLIVTQVVEAAPTRPATERRKFGGL